MRFGKFNVNQPRGLAVYLYPSRSHYLARRRCVHHANRQQAEALLVLAFQLSLQVTFGSTAATSVVVSSTSITTTAPVGSAGAVTVTVTNSNGLSGSLGSAFTYVIPPTVSSVSPNSGPTAGGTAVTITGTNFAAGRR